jgi:ankyrin repeat protein
VSWLLFGLSPLASCGHHGKVDVAELLLERHADVNAIVRPTNLACSALSAFASVACAVGAKQALTMLLADSHGATLLLLAASYGHCDGAVVY